MSRRLRRTDPALREEPVTSTAPPFLHRSPSGLALHFSIHEVQSYMRADDPDALALSYTRLMMGFLLWEPQPQRIGLIGLGGGSLVKFCHRHLGASRLEVVEIHPEVIALRDDFELPADDDRLTIRQADGVAWVRKQREAFDVLLVDGYDESGLPSALATRRFYNDCRSALRPGGWLVANLFGDHPQHAQHLERLRLAFDQAVLTVPDLESGVNRAVFAGGGDALHQPLAEDALAPPGMAPEAWDSLAAEMAALRSAHAQRLQSTASRRARATTASG